MPINFDLSRPGHGSDDSYASEPLAASRCCIPVVAATAAVDGSVLGFGKEKIAEQMEKHQAEHSMLGILATVRPN